MDEICKDCNGEGKYEGLNEVEDPCETCGGDGRVCETVTHTLVFSNGDETNEVEVTCRLGISLRQPDEKRFDLIERSQELVKEQIRACESLSSE
jgi:DnaJ-class molecular chaperone